MGNDVINKVTVGILAGGKGRRQGNRDKGLLLLDGQPLIQHILQSLPEGVPIMINANRHIEAYQVFGHTVVQDELSDYQGPLAGFSALLNRMETDYLITLPCDAPRIPPDYLPRMVRCVESTKGVVVADTGNRLQPVYAIIKRNLLPSLNVFLQSGDRKIDRWYQQVGFQCCNFSDCPTAFDNINNPDELQAWQSRIAAFSPFTH